MQVSLDKTQMLLAALVGSIRQIWALARNQQNTGGADANNAWSRHIEGAGGEMAAAKALNVFFPATVNNGKGFDIGQLQIRTRSSHDYDLKVLESDCDDHVFLLVTGRMPHYKIRGWMYGREAKQAKWWKDPGHIGQPAYFVPVSELRQVSEIPKELLAA